MLKVTDPEVPFVPVLVTVKLRGEAGQYQPWLSVQSRPPSVPESRKK